MRRTARRPRGARVLGVGPSARESTPDLFGDPVIRWTIRLREDPDWSLDRFPVADSRDLARVVREIIGDLDREAFVVVALNSKHVPIGYQVVSLGTIDATLVHAREVFKVAILASAAAIAVAHNHPSGNPSPSWEDREVTRRLVRSGALLGIPVIDSLIVGVDERWTSMREEDPDLFE